MLLQGVPQPPELPQDGHPLVVQRGHPGLRVDVPVDRGAHPKVVPPAQPHQPRLVVVLQPAHDLNGVVLPPSLVERDPDRDAGVVVKRVHAVQQLVLENFREQGVQGVLAVVVLPVGPPSGGLGPVRHVLPHQHPHPVAVVVPPLALHLDVLPDHVEPHALRDLDVPLEGLLGGRGVEPVGPPALVQDPVLEEVLIVQLEPLDAVHVGSHGDLPHGGVAPDHVDVVVRLLRDDRVVQVDLHVVKERALRGPEPGLVALVEADLHLVVGRARGEAHELALAKDLDEEAVVPSEYLLPHARHHRDRVRVDVGDHPDPLDIGLLGDALQPHGLPDPAVRGVPHPEGLHHPLAGERVPALLAPGLDPVVRGVVHPHHHLLLGRAGEVQEPRDVELEGVVPPRVLAHGLAVDVHDGLPVHRPEVEDEPALGLAVVPRQGELPPVPQEVVLGDPALHAGEDALYGEGHEDVPVKLPGRLALLYPLHGVLPEPVQADPVLLAAPHHRGPGVLGVHDADLRVELLPPPRQQPATGGGGARRRRRGGGRRAVHLGPPLSALRGERLALLLVVVVVERPGHDDDFVLPLVRLVCQRRNHGFGFARFGPRGALKTNASSPLRGNE
mmetsp:Transcript_9725/g.27709  ORF Transcript_9725/g.27709 Transcript_9725/m.27709 type:complete len:614 (-) Transcript_9725:198-2039(-)